METYSSNKTLWSNADRTRFFLIPDGVEVPAGDYKLQTVIGRERRTTEEAVASFEVSREEAREAIMSQLGGVLDEAKDRLTGFLSKARTASKSRTEAALNAIPSEERQHQVETIEFFAEGLERAAAKAGGRLRRLARKLQRRDRDLD